MQIKVIKLMKITIPNPLILLLSILVIGCNSNNPFKNNKNVSQATGWKISTKDGGFKNKKLFLENCVSKLTKIKLDFKFKKFILIEILKHLSKVILI